MVIITIAPPPSSFCGVPFLIRQGGLGGRTEISSADGIEIEIIETTPIVLSADGTMRAAAGG